MMCCMWSSVINMTAQRQLLHLYDLCDVFAQQCGLPVCGFAPRQDAMHRINDSMTRYATASVPSHKLEPMSLTACHALTDYTRVHVMMPGLQS
jgi:hypothetical protein